MKNLILTTTICALLLPALAHEKGKTPQPKSCCMMGASKAALLKKKSSPAGTATAVFSVAGMECEGCSSALQAGLAKEKGVRAAQVDFKTKRATLQFDAKQTDAKKLEAAFGRNGFPAKLLKN